MPKADRLAVIGQLEELRKSRVLTYVTADRGLVNNPVAEDIVRKAYRHLRQFGQIERLDLFIYSRGGDTNVPWPLVSICRSVASRFNVLVPFRAHSAATQIAMGADTIVMGPMGELTQVDPSLRTDYTPPNPAQAGQTLFVSVEDLKAYFEFFRQQLKEEPGAVASAIELLRDKVHPLAVGQVHRMSNSIRYISETLLGTHLNDKDAISRIASAMLTEAHVHSHKIKQSEAARIGLPAVEASAHEADLMWSLFEMYETEMGLEIPLRPSSIFPNSTDNYVELKDQKMVYVESAGRTDVFLVDVLASRTLVQIQQQSVPGQLAQPALPLQMQPAGPAAAPQAPIVSRPIWGPNLSFAVEQERWSTE